VVACLLDGEYTKPLLVRTAEGWASDVSEEVAWEVTRRVRLARNAGGKIN
jgi:hypothetical protein